MTTASYTYSYCQSDSIGNTCGQNCCSVDTTNSWVTKLCSPYILCANSQTYSMTSVSQTCNYDSFGDKCAQNCCLSSSSSGVSQMLCTSRSVCQGNVTVSSYGSLLSSAASSNSNLTSAIIGVSVSLSIVIVILLIALIIQCRQNFLLNASLRQNAEIPYFSTQQELKH